MVTCPNPRGLTLKKKIISLVRNCFFFFIQHLGGLVALSFPCHNNETCDRELPFIQYLASISFFIFLEFFLFFIFHSNPLFKKIGRNLLAPNYFPSLLYPVHPTDREDMVPDVRNFYFSFLFR